MCEICQAAETETSADLVCFDDSEIMLIKSTKSVLKETKASNMIAYREITKDWTDVQDKKASVIEKRSYIINGVTYIVDGKHVILRLSEQERKIADILSRKYGKKVEMVPQIMYPQGIQTPDYLIDGERFDLKSPTGNGKNLLYDVVVKKRKQSSNFIFDITNCPLAGDEIERQIKNIYHSRHTWFVDKIVVMKNGQVLKVYERQ